MKKSIKTTLGLAACLAVAGAAYATTTFWPDGDNTSSNQGAYGFVGKGDVAQPWGWNDSKLQNNAEGVTFTYEEVASYTFLCSRIHSQHGYQEQTFPNKVIGVNATVARELRKNGNGKVTGFMLTELSDEVVSGEGCPSGWPNEVSREANEDAGTVIGIVAHHPDELDLELDTIILPE